MPLSFHRKPGFVDRSVTLLCIPISMVNNILGTKLDTSSSKLIESCALSAMRKASSRTHGNTVMEVNRRSTVPSTGLEELTTTSQIWSATAPRAEGASGS